MSSTLTYVGTYVHVHRLVVRKTWLTFTRKTRVALHTNFVMLICFLHTYIRLVQLHIHTGWSYLFTHDACR